MSLSRALAIAALAATPAAAQPPAGVGPALAQVRRFAAEVDRLIWPGYGAAPFGMLLVEGDRETLLCQPGTPAGFTAASPDPATGCERWTRARTALPGGLLAAMPLLGPPSTIVMGTPAATGRSDGSWLRTILHEHFHQWQASLPDYYPRVEALGLARGDPSGMWMLNFPFPYDDARAGAAYAAASSALADALAERGRPGFLAAFDRYAAARRAFARSVSRDEWRYIDFQLWQEGTARWTEIQLGRIYPDSRVRREAEAQERATLEGLRKPDLKGQRREIAYPLGGGEAMLMAACGPAWREAYPKVVGHDPLLPIARRACAGVRGSG